ncbi:hypothetical protein [Carboxylicivirga marina]|uniref:Porin n=1 Tax=Carboxylicivirga marina TaxID=2800988 RepID=A0ABS1HMP2_9BACT|nr:hypothetical protein [Carboxylicivirga marina]MBK3518949.1 hypothetical protein [Carboxylicivirga marina]
MLRKISLIFLVCSPFYMIGQERLLKVTSKDSLMGEPRIAAWFGANMKMNGYYNIKGGLQDYDTFNLGNVDVNGDDDRQNLGVDLHQTQIRLDAAYIHPELGKIRAHVEWDFWGGNGQMRLRKAYVKTNHWQFGQDWENFGNQNVWPNVLDFDGPPSGVWARLPFVKYFNNLRNEHWKYELALQAPIVNYDEYLNVTPTIQETYQNLPEAVAALSYWDKWGHVRLSTIVRGINYLEDQEEKRTVGYGASVSGMIGAFGRSNFQFQYAAGMGIAAYLVSHGGSGFDAYPSNNTFKTTPTHGGWMSYEYYLSKKVHFNGVIGFTNFRMNDVTEFETTDDVGNSITVSDGNAQIMHDYFLVNVLWDPYPNFTLGVEFDYGTKSVETDGVADGVPFANDNSRNASRVSFGFMYNF